MYRTVLLIERTYKNDFASIVRLLRSTDVDVNAVDPSGRTALHLAMVHQCTSAAIALASAKADVNLRDYKGITPLWHAAAWGNLEGVDFLIQLGADVDLSNDQGVAPMSATTTATRNAEPIIKALIGAKADTNKTDKQGRTALHWAANNGNVAAVKALLTDERIDMNKGHPQFGTALMIATIYGHADVVAELLKHKGRLDLNKPAGGKTPLAAAKANNRANIAAMLVSAGAKWR
ncbi:ankyrin repeat domain-containing protein [Piscinibacter sp. XHJ-5]|uniref:ankyrin repeat domain-containing protein n=1 Tax=Piscinibacter sp. XHJ-5 TaxID=3037797 RepID=UPI002452C234|nr:ankyrin repeat domain-containing protein [Piscinibacter sp. XHJ-5]